MGVVLNRFLDERNPERGIRHVNGYTEKVRCRVRGNDH